MYALSQAVAHDDMTAGARRRGVCALGRSPPEPAHGAWSPKPASAWTRWCRSPGEAALGGQRLTKVELEGLARSAAAKQQLVRVRGEWVQLDQSELAAMIERVGSGGAATAGELLRAGFGLGDLEVSDGLEVSGVVAKGWLGELLDEIVDSGDKVLCFTQFTEWGDLLVPHLSRRYGTEPLWLHGGVRRARREEMMAGFQEPGGPQIFLLSLEAGGTGLNLTAVSHVVHLDRWWNPAVEDQATDRAFRIGQRRTVLVHKLVSTGTIEERIDEMITSKRGLAERVVGAGEQWITKLDTDALREVVALRLGEAD